MLQRGLHTVQFCTAGLNGVDRVRVYRVDIFILYLGGGACKWRQDHSNEPHSYMMQYKNESKRVQTPEY